MIIYKATNKINGKCYIGQTTFDLQKRKSEHMKRIKKTKPPKTYFHKALKSYGPKNFKWKVLYECDGREELDNAEIRYINQFNSYGDGGYNLTEGGGGSVGYKFTPETLKKISEKTKEGIAKSDKSWSESHMGDKNGMYGKNHTKKSIKKMKSNRKGKALGDKNSSVKNAGTYKITYPDDTIIIVKNMRGWCRENGLKHRPFYAMCNNKRNERFEGYWCERLIPHGSKNQ